jgi:hypothetical protein
MNAWVLPGFFCGDLVAILIKCIEDGAEMRVVVCSDYLPYDSKDPPLSRKMEELVRYCENGNLRLLVGCDSNAHHTAWGSTNCNGRGYSLLEFLNYSNLDILNWANESTFCNASRQEVIDIYLGSYGLLESIIGWDMSEDPSLSDHRHILFTVRGSVTGTALRLLGPDPALGVSRRNLHKSLGRWLANQHGSQWRGLGDTQRQAREFISGPSLGTRAKFMTFYRIQSRVVAGLLMGNNTLRRHLYLLGLLDSPLCRK